MDLNDLVPFIKKALEQNGISTEDIQRELMLAENHDGANGLPQEDQGQIDQSILDTTSKGYEEAKNEEAEAMESSFAELKVENAIEAAKDKKDFPVLAKMSSWDILVARYNGNNNRQTTP